MILDVVKQSSGLVVNMKVEEKESHQVLLVTKQKEKAKKEVGEIGQQQKSA